MRELRDVIDDLRERARFYAGLSSIGVSPELATPAAAPPSPPTAILEGSSITMSARNPDGAARLKAVRDLLGDCQRCKLARYRKNIVFGQGNPDARLMFVGEAPGADEDEQGLAFVGKAGQLLTRIIEAIGLRREDVWIGNVLRCRPPQNRNPEPDEILACQPFLDQTIDAIRPEVIVGLGKFGAQWLLKTAEPITRLRGRLGEYKGVKVMPTYHPAYLLRNPGAKKDVWEDMKVVRQLLRG